MVSFQNGASTKGQWARQERPQVWGLEERKKKKKKRGDVSDSESFRLLPMAISSAYEDEEEEDLLF